jgi:hypothetical protein
MNGLTYSFKMILWSVSGVTLWNKKKTMEFFCCPASFLISHLLATKLAQFTGPGSPPDSTFSTSHTVNGLPDTDREVQEE